MIIIFPIKAYSAETVSKHFYTTLKYYPNNSDANT